MPTQPHTPTPPGKGPAERRWNAAYNQARQTGDLLTLELLDDAWAAAWRESAGTEPGQSREKSAPSSRGSCTGKRKEGTTDDSRPLRARHENRPAATPACLPCCASTRPTGRCRRQRGSSTTS